MSELEEALAFQLKAAKLTGFKREVRFHSQRQWRFDFLYPEEKLAVEVEGGVHSGGRHVRGGGFEKDCEKYNEAALMGYTVLRFTAKSVLRGTALVTIRRALEERRSR